ncbi:MAG: hypothetical protein ABIR39_08580 [Nocardioides sp.]|uniref:hypothetical protein n=1 Tax=Nocardioides sp. TaxID=35761 RepID=UPI003267206B
MYDLYDERRSAGLAWCSHLHRRPGTSRFSSGSTGRPELLTAHTVADLVELRDQALVDQAGLAATVLAAST